MSATRDDNYVHFPLNERRSVGTNWPKPGWMHWLVKFVCLVKAEKNNLYSKKKKKRFPHHLAQCTTQIELRRKRAMDLICVFPIMYNGERERGGGRGRIVSILIVNRYYNDDPIDLIHCGIRKKKKKMAKKRRQQKGKRKKENISK